MISGTGRMDFDIRVAPKLKCDISDTSRLVISTGTARLSARLECDIRQYKVIL